MGKKERSSVIFGSCSFLRRLPGRKERASDGPLELHRITVCNRVVSRVWNDVWANRLFSFAFDFLVPGSILAVRACWPFCVFPIVWGSGNVAKVLVRLFSYLVPLRFSVSLSVDRLLLT